MIGNVHLSAGETNRALIDQRAQVRSTAMGRMLLVWFLKTL